MKLNNCKALVTGGTRGIGAAIVSKLLNEGVFVTFTGTKKQNLDMFDTNCEYRLVDFSNIKNTENFIKEIEKSSFDILINNAGINKIAPFTEILPEDFDRIHLVNVRAPFRLCQAVIPTMKKNGWGRIVNISSIFGVISKEYRACYSSSKFAIDGMTTALAAEVAQFGILANCVAPGFINTELTKGILGTEGMRSLESCIPMRRFGNVAEIATFVTWLCSSENSYISGQNIVIDGGFLRV